MMALDMSSIIFDKKVYLTGGGIGISVAWLSGILEGHIVVPHYSWKEKIRYGTLSLPYTVMGQNVPIKSIPDNTAAVVNSESNRSRRRMRLSPLNLNDKLKEIETRPVQRDRRQFGKIEPPEWRCRIQRIFRTGRAVCLSSSLLFSIMYVGVPYLQTYSIEKSSQRKKNKTGASLIAQKRIPLFIHPDEIKQERAKVQWKIVKEQIKHPNSEIIPITIHSSAPSDDSFNENDAFISISILNYIMHEINKTKNSLKEKFERKKDKNETAAISNSASPLTATDNKSIPTVSVQDEEDTQAVVESTKSNKGVIVYSFFDNVGKIIRLTWENYVWQTISHLDSVGKTIRLTWKAYVWRPLHKRVFPLVTNIPEQPKIFLIFITHNEFESLLPFFQNEYRNSSDTKVLLQHTNQIYQSDQTQINLIRNSKIDCAECCYIIWGSSDEETCLLTHQLVSKGENVISILQTQQCSLELKQICPTVEKNLCLDEVHLQVVQKARSLVSETKKSRQEISRELSSF